MAELSSPAPAAYRLVAVKLAASPVILKAILESWCCLNCTGAWSAVVDDLGDSKPIGIHLDFHEDGDAMLFMLSPEYGYIGRPRLTTLTKL